jgi:hypothetical protein
LCTVRYVIKIAIEKNYSTTGVTKKKISYPAASVLMQILGLLSGIGSSRWWNKTALQIISFTILIGAGTDQAWYVDANLEICTGSTGIRFPKNK